MSFVEKLDYSPPENVPEAVTALTQRYRNLHVEDATAYLFLVDRHHRIREGEPLTDANYTKGFPRIAKGDRQLGLYSEGVDRVFEDLLERGEHRVVPGLENVWEFSWDDTQEGKLLVEPPQDTPTDSDVENYVNQALDEIAEARGEDPFNPYQILTEEEDVMRTVVTKPVTP